MLIKAVLFDLDGTLVDTLEDLANATNTVLRQKGFDTHPTDAYRRFVGNGARLLISRAAGTENKDTVDELLSLFLTEYDAHCLDCCRAYDGAIHIVSDMRRRGLRLGIVTNKPQQQALRIAPHFFGDAFPVLYGGCPDYPKKPNPTSAYAAMRDLGVKPEETLFVGDSNVDVQTAHNAGLRVVGACWGFRGEQELRAAGADDFAYSFHDLQNFY